MDYVEIDVMTSRDGVMYVFHGPELEKTTDGRGLIFEYDAEELDQLDAGGWFGPQFAGERIPRLEDFLRWIKGRAKVFLDVKLADLEELVPLIYNLGLENDCFFWFELDQASKIFRELAPDLMLKFNASSAAEVETAVTQYQADIIETGYPICPEVAEACRQHNLKLMVNYGGDDESTFAEIIRQQPDMVNVNFGDRFARVAEEMRAQ
jgi:glycerophosphoryl diester phosphodiesterase